MPPRKASTQPVFEVRANLIYEIHAKDQMEALNKILGALTMLNPLGCITRAVKWSQVSEIPLMEAKGKNHLCNNTEEALIFGIGGD